MDEIMRMLEDYRQNPKSLAAPDIPRNVLRFLEPGLTEAKKVDARRTDPLFGYGSDSTYECVNANGVRMTLMSWGNTDGHGLLEVSES